MKEELNEKQKQFCLEYLKDFNATQAYKKVYWVSDETANTAWPRLLVNVGVQKYLADKVQKKVEKLDIWVEYVLDNLHQIVEIWMWRQAVNINWEEKEVFDLKNVNSALEKLWKYHKMYTDRVENDWDVTFRIVSFKTNPDPEEWQDS